MYVLYFTIFNHDFRNSCLQLFCKKCILKNSRTFIGKNLCRSKNKIASILNRRGTFVETIGKYMKKIQFMKNSMIFTVSLKETTVKSIMEYYI